jgi:hypothetical protein
MPQYITEILGRSQQGRTQPYVCLADNAEVYFVKGKIATRRGLVNEWVCGRLAQGLGLPIAPFALLEVSDELIAASQMGAIKLDDLGPGTVFGSKRATGVELTPSHVLEVPIEIQKAVAVFDWWVHNGDRCLTALGGNVNLLWNQSDEAHLVVIDHNLAFEDQFSADDFCHTHVFADAFRLVCTDAFERLEWQAKLVKALETWDSICGTIPYGWGFIDPEQTLPAHVNLASMHKTLARCNSDTFWNIAP